MILKKKKKKMMLRRYELMIKQLVKSAIYSENKQKSPPWKNKNIHRKEKNGDICMIIPC